MLSEVERQKAASFVKESDQKNYLLSHLFLRKILSSYAPEVRPSEWSFSHNVYGKPAIANSISQTLYFNLSHTHSCAYVIVSNVSECGIDVEEKRKIPLTKGLTELVFSEEERYYYDTIEDKETMFYRFWTLKEAHLKALGSGLMEVPPGDLNFHGKTTLEQKHDYFSIRKTQYWSQSLDNDCFLAFCVLNSREKMQVNYRNYKELNYSK